MTVRIRRGSSRLVHSTLVVIDGVEFWTRPNLPELTPSSMDKQHLVADPERIDSIANARYKRDDWWWVLAHRNDLRLLPSALIPGQSIIVTDVTQVRRELF